MRIIFVNYVWYNCERFEPRKESWCTTLEQTPLNRSQQLLALQGCQKVFKQQAENEQQAVLELTTKAQVLEGRGIQGHSENQSLGNGISRGFQEVVLTANTIVFRQYTEKTGNNAIEMSEAFQDIACFERFTDLNLLEYTFNLIQNWEMDAVQFFSMMLIFCQHIWQIRR